MTTIMLAVLLAQIPTTADEPATMQQLRTVLFQLPTTAAEKPLDCSPRAVWEALRDADREFVSDPLSPFQGTTLEYCNPLCELDRQKAKLIRQSEVAQRVRVVVEQCEPKEPSK